MLFTNESRESESILTLNFTPLEVRFAPSPRLWPVDERVNRMLAVKEFLALQAPELDDHKVSEPFPSHIISVNSLDTAVAFVKIIIPSHLGSRVNWVKSRAF